MTLQEAQKIVHDHESGDYAHLATEIKLAIAKVEMSNQVGIHLEEHNGVGYLNDITCLSCPTRFVGGWVKEVKQDTINNNSRREWFACAEAIIDELKSNNYNFIITSTHTNGFTIEEE